MIKLDRNKIYSHCHFAIALIAVQLWKPLKIFLLSNVSSFHLFIKWGCEAGIKNWSATCLMIVVCAHFPFFLPPPLGMLNSQAPLNSMKENSFYQSFFFSIWSINFCVEAKSINWNLHTASFLSAIHSKLSYQIWSCTEQAVRSWSSCSVWCHDRGQHRPDNLHWTR